MDILATHPHTTHTTLAHARAKMYGDTCTNAQSTEDEASSTATRIIQDSDANDLEDDDYDDDDAYFHWKRDHNLMHDHTRQKKQYHLRPHWTTNDAATTQEHNSEQKRNRSDDPTEATTLRPQTDNTTIASELINEQEQDHPHPQKPQSDTTSLADHNYGQNKHHTDTQYTPQR